MVLVATAYHSNKRRVEQAAVKQANAHHCVRIYVPVKQVYTTCLPKDSGTYIHEQGLLAVPP